jgi:zinc transport system substrate-binding protein
MADVYYLYDCPHCRANFTPYEDETDAMAEGLRHYHSTQHTIGEIKHFDGRGYENITETTFHEAQPFHSQPVHHEHHQHHEHGHHDHHEHGHHEHGHHEHGHHEHGSA